MASEFRVTQHILDGFTQGICEPTQGFLGRFGVALDRYLVVHGKDGYRSGMLFLASCEQVVQRGGGSVFPQGTDRRSLLVLVTGNLDNLVYFTALVMALGRR